jgi:RNA polymerase sigma-70 factor (ECF subfamily)
VKAEDFDRLFHEHAEPLLGFLTYRTGDRALAEDLLADTFERVLTARRGFNAQRGSEKSWLYTIALNLVRDHARRQSTETRVLAEIGTAADTTSPGPGDVIERRQLISESLEVLAEEEREAVALRFGADLTVPEMAKLLGQPLTTVEGRVYRALRKLRDELEA